MQYKLDRFETYGQIYFLGFSHACKPMYVNKKVKAVQITFKHILCFAV